jgi:hypothetical protein
VSPWPNSVRAGDFPRAPDFFELRRNVVTVVVVVDVDETGEPILHVKILRRFIWVGTAV